MEVKKVALVLADISGYTCFIKNREISLLHAEQIITELLEAVIDTAEYPLTLNKLEGDAALLFTPVEADATAVTKDVARQAVRFFEAFKSKRQALVDGIACSCDACTHIENLELKAFLHLGEAVVKRVRQFEELGGEDVILIHRLLKNSLEAHEYLLLTSPFHRASGALPNMRAQEHIERYDDIGPIQTMVYFPQVELVLSTNQPPGLASRRAKSIRMTLEAMGHFLIGRKLGFQHLPR